MLISKRKLNGKITLPSSKSFLIRAIFLGALSKGKSEIYFDGVLCGDVEDALSAANAFGAKTTVGQRSITVVGTDNLPNVMAFTCEGSAAVFRFTLALCAVSGSKAIITKGNLLRKRDFSHELSQLQKYGILTSDNKNETRLEGKINTRRISVDARETSQLASGFIIAFAALGTGSVTAEKAVSRPYLDMTVNTVEKFGCKVEKKGDTYTVSGEISGTDLHCEGDASSGGAVMACCAAAGGEVTVCGIDSMSMQADIAALKMFRQAGCFVLSGDGSVLLASEGKPKAFDFDFTDCPDLFPVAAALSAVSNGKSVLSGISRLENKESPRGDVMCSVFDRIGVKYEKTHNTLTVYGEGELKNKEPLTLSAEGDHRIAHALTVLAHASEGGIEIVGAQTASKSYPGFFDDMEFLSRTEEGEDEN